jgi:hypothetical protein
MPANACIGEAGTKEMEGKGKNGIGPVRKRKGGLGGWVCFDYWKIKESLPMFVVRLQPFHPWGHVRSPCHHHLKFQVFCSSLQSTEYSFAFDQSPRRDVSCIFFSFSSLSLVLSFSLLCSEA